jgi:hypothetical protein
MPGRLIIYIVHKLTLLGGLLTAIAWLAVYTGLLKSWWWVIVPFFPTFLGFTLLSMFFVWVSFSLLKEGQSVKEVMKGWYDVFTGKRQL